MPARRRTQTPASALTRRQLLWAALAAAFAPAVASAGPIDWINGVKVGKVLPAHDMDYLGVEPIESPKISLVNFWATWCGPCRAHFPKLNAWHEAYAQRGLAVIGVTSEASALIEAFLAKVDIRYPIGAGGKQPLKEALGVKALPYALIADRAGEVLWRGQPDRITDALIERLLAQADTPARG